MTLSLDIRDIAVPLENWIDKLNYELPDLTFLSGLLLKIKWEELQRDRILF